MCLLYLCGKIRAIYFSPRRKGAKNQGIIEIKDKLCVPICLLCLCGKKEGNSIDSRKDTIPRSIFVDLKDRLQSQIYFTTT